MREAITAGLGDRGACAPATGPSRAALLAAALLLSALCMLALSCAALYRPLELALDGAAPARYHVLVYGGALSDAALARASRALPAGVELQRGSDGATYGYASANSAWGCALSELRLRSALGAAVRADRWITATAATRVERRAALPTGRDLGATLSDAPRRLLAACADESRTSYVGANCASARGARYHAAVRAGAVLTYMLADGYLPIDY